MGDAEKQTAIITLYADLSEVRYRYTACNATGQAGPSPIECTNYYTRINSPLIKDDVFFTFSSSSLAGAQGFTAPREALYEFTAAGAAGGRGLCNTERGRGLIAKHQRTLTKGFQYLVLVGQRGIGPCDVAPSHSLCQDPPADAQGVRECEDEWMRTSPDVFSYAGGGGGGGGSMLWETNSSEASFGFFPLVLAGGGGGTSRVLNYSIAETLSNAFNLTTVNCSGVTSETCYRMLIDARPQVSDGAIGQTGVPGFRATDVLPIAGVGGGFFPGSSGLSQDGQQLGDIERFASGGFSCLRGSIYEASEFLSVTGGFGGGGGACVEGGGGGGYAGGNLLSLGSSVPGGGGFSTVTGTRDVPEGDFSWNDGDGYVDILPLDCGCVHQCMIYEEENEFQCTCPEGAQLAFDQNDCYEGMLWNIVQYSGFQFIFCDCLRIHVTSRRNCSESHRKYSVSKALRS